MYKLGRKLEVRQLRIANQTACVDGYVNGWKHWCMTDMKDCAKYMTMEAFPGKLIRYDQVVNNGTKTNSTGNSTDPQATNEPSVLFQTARK
jgi:hypothetical protein